MIFKISWAADLTRSKVWRVHVWQNYNQKTDFVTQGVAKLLTRDFAF